ncbi:MAG: hypothetical protein WCP35_19300, partial [Verrucomicrobiota bacterium]
RVLFPTTIGHREVQVSDVVAYGTEPGANITTAGTLSAVATTYGTASVPATFTVSGAYMTAGILVTAPTGFEVSQTSGSGYGATTTVAGSGTIASTTVYVRLSATATVSGSYNAQNIVLTSTGATLVNVTTAASGNSVSKADSSLTPPTVGTYTYTGSPQGPYAGASATGSTGSVTYSYAGTGSTSYGPSATQPTNAGSYTATATVAADSNHNSASSSAAGFSIGKASQTISFTLTASAAKADGSVSLTGSASSGLSVSYASSAPAIASASGSTLTLNQGGSVTVTASQAGDTNYTAATAVPQTLLVTGFAAVDDAVSRPAGSSGIKIPVATLLANDGQMGSNSTVTPGTGLTITGVSAGAGNSVRLSGAFVLFAPNDPAASGATTFTYTVSDGPSTATATVTVSTVDATPFSLALLRVVTAPVFANNQTSVTIEFAGVPGQTYQIEYSTNLGGWSAPQAMDTGSTGTFEATFTAAGNQLPAWNSLFFRASR